MKPLLDHFQFDRLGTATNRFFLRNSFRCEVHAQGRNNENGKRRILQALEALHGVILLYVFVGPCFQLAI